MYSKPPSHLPPHQSSFSKTQQQISRLNSVITSAKRNISRPVHPNAYKSHLSESRDSKYHIHIDDDHTESRVDLTVAISEFPTKQYQTKQSQQYEHMNYKPYTPKREEADIPTERRKEEKSFAPITYRLNEGTITYSRKKLMEETNYIEKKHNFQPSPQVFQYGEEEEVYSPMRYSYREGEIHRKIDLEDEKTKRKRQIKVDVNPQKKQVIRYVDRSSQEGKIKTVSISLDKFSKKEPEDFFTSQKNEYLNSLKKKEKSYMRKKPERTRTKSKNKSLSPECQRITNRLYKSSINNYPCKKCIKHHQQYKNKAEKIMEQFTFLRRYLTEKEVELIIQKFEDDGSPEYQWPMKIVELVYDSRIAKH